jgi:hypothetical protein
MPLILHVQCANCGAYGYTDRTGPGDLDHAVRCISGHDDPPGSVEGCCSTLGHTHDEHVAHVRETGDASARPVIVTVGPAGPVELSGTL